MFRSISITDQFSYMYKGNTYDLKLNFSGTRFMIRLALIDAVTNHDLLCFPISDHVVVLYRTVPLKFSPYARASTCICMHNLCKGKREIPGRTSRGTCKLKIVCAAGAWRQWAPAATHPKLERSI